MTGIQTKDIRRAVRMMKKYKVRNLMCRFDDPDSGRVIDMTPEDLQKKMARAEKEGKTYKIRGLIVYSKNDLNGG